MVAGDDAQRGPHARMARSAANSAAVPASATSRSAAPGRAAGRRIDLGDGRGQRAIRIHHAVVGACRRAGTTRVREAGRSTWGRGARPQRRCAPLRPGGGSAVPRSIDLSTTGAGGRLQAASREQQRRHGQDTGPRDVPSSGLGGPAEARLCRRSSHAEAAMCTPRRSCPGQPAAASARTAARMPEIRRCPTRSPRHRHHRRLRPL